MPTLSNKAEKVVKLSAQLQYALNDWETHRREEDRRTVLTAVQTMSKYLEAIAEGVEGRESSQA
jgi:hypothetical protein